MLHQIDYDVRCYVPTGTKYVHYYTYPNNYWENVVCTTYEITSFDGYINHRIYIKDHKNMKGEYHTEIHAYDKNYNLLDRTPMLTTTIK